MTRDPRIDAYIEHAQPFARPILDHVRARVHAVLPEVEETLKWSSPAFTVGGKLLLMMAAFKAHAAVNFWRGEELAKTGRGKEAMGQFGRLTSLADLPPDGELDALIRKATELGTRAPAPRKPKHPKPELEPHADFVAALAKAPMARSTFDGFPPSCRREYVDWINQAKRDETRARRVATAIEWLSEGKRHNWRYEKC